MTTKAETIKKDYPIVPAGTHLARCYQFIHLGHVPNTFPGATTPTVNKIRLTWEFPQEMHQFKEGQPEQPFSISQEYTLSMNEKANLRKIVESWFGIKLGDEEAANFDTELLVGKECLLTITHTQKGDKIYAGVQNVTSLPKGMSCPDPINKTSILTWEGMNADDFSKIPAFIQDKMKQATEYPVWCEKNNVEAAAF